MFSLFGPEESIKNVYKLSCKFFDENRITDTNSLKHYYLNFLSVHQPHQPINRSSIFFITDEEISNKLKKAYHSSGLNDLNQQGVLGQSMAPDERSQLIDLVGNGYEHLSRANPKLKALFDLVIHSIFFVKSHKGKLGAISFGGSSSTAMGTIWISGHGNLTKHDIAEFLLHELTHHLLFVAERCIAQFKYTEMILPENFAQSAILNRKRPLDKVVHSVAVSTEILLARRSFLPPVEIIIHPDSQTLEKQTLFAIDDVFKLKKLEKVLTPWTIDLLHRCKAALTIRESVAC
ncbi:MAG: hypothetical protein A3I05_02355 [Deltaproteobacteria bacterium RIFCSPLOWO2_02_FULL_44_10]|nr:MAG: hypothetical protein A3I05_02355 [Deltaproteobacteria bacterium RIFCSPLOWO2_02_FULL_44_10]